MSAVNHAELARLKEKLDKLQAAYGCSEMPTVQPKCVTRYFFRTDVAKLDSYLDDLAGKEVFNVMVDTWLTQLTFTLKPDGHPLYTLPLNRFDAKKGHDFPNTGAQRSWCNHCGAVAHFNWRSGAYEAA